MAIATINPATGELVKTYEPISPAEVERRLAASQAAFASWRRMPVAERAAVLTAVADILEREKESFGALMTHEMGKPLRAAIEEAQKCAAGCRHYAQHGQRYLAEDTMLDPGGTRERVLYQPLGAVLAIMPWNFPFWQVIRFAAPALVAGNVVLLKHAPSVPQCALALEDLLRRAGAPAGVFQSLLVETEAVEAIIADPRVVAVTLTGSDRAGRAVAATAGRHLKKSVLELGGSDPFIVMPSADLDRAVDTAVRARVVNNGQSCIAAKRFFVAAPIADAFIERFVATMANLRVGDPMLPETDIGPLATEAIRAGLHAQVERSIAAGARVLTGGHPLPRPGFFYAPTVLGDVPPDAPAAREELFGPVAAVWPVADLEDAIGRANASPYGLGAAVWTRERDEAERAAVELDAGMVFINGMVASDPRQPFGGIKQSGYGRELGVLGLREFVNVKRVRVAV
jgi:succinate-semialdehyde dehydrogenase/glutarate-semialdehyde dehydrogenase